IPISCSGSERAGLAERGLTFGCAADVGDASGALVAAGAGSPNGGKSRARRSANGPVLHAVRDSNRAIEKTRASGMNTNLLQGRGLLSDPVVALPQAAAGGGGMAARFRLTPPRENAAMTTSERDFF